MTRSEVAEDRAAAILAAAEYSKEQEREACTVLAGKALDATGGDWDAAADALRPVLEAVGAIEYETAQPRGMWGR